MAAVILSAIPFDPTGWVEIDAIEDDSTSAISRRVSRSATLDGGAAFNDFGMSDADRSFEVRWRSLPLAAENEVRRMVRLYALIRIATSEGVFIAAPESYRSSGDESILRLLVSSRETS